MKVLMFGWEFPPHISGGLGTACLGITSGLLKQGVEVLFVVPRLYGDEDKEKFQLLNASDVAINVGNSETREWWDKLTYLQVNSPLTPYVSPEAFIAGEYFSSKQESTHQNPLSMCFQLSGKYDNNLINEIARYALVASEIAKENSFDLIHAHDWLTFPAGIAAKEATGKSLVVHVHATEFDRSGENINQQVYEIEKRGMEKADRVIAVSELTRQTIISRYGIDANKVKVVHNGVTPKSDGQESVDVKKMRDKVVTFMGRITFQKGPDYFVETANKVLKKIPNVRFVMAGNGDMMNRMIKRVAELRISSRFHFTGFLKGNDVDRMYAMSDIYVMPSVSEPFGIAPLEAMLANVPVIISKQSGVSEVIKNVVKVDFWDTDALANAICSLLSHKSLTNTFGKMGKEEAGLLSWENTAHKLKEMYESTTQNQYA